MGRQIQSLRSGKGLRILTVSLTGLVAVLLLVTDSEPTEVLADRSLDGLRGPVAWTADGLDEPWSSSVAVVEPPLPVEGPDDRSVPDVTGLGSSVTESASPLVPTTVPNPTTVSDPTTSTRPTTTSTSIATTSAEPVDPSVASAPASSSSSLTTDSSAPLVEESPSTILPVAPPDSDPTQPSIVAPVDEPTTSSPATSTPASSSSAPTTTLSPISTSTETSTSSTTAASSTSAPVEVSAPSPAPDLGPVEAEIARLTNQLRVDPNGPVRRLGPPIDCGGRIGLDGDGYLPVPPLIVSVEASVEVARPWAAQLTTNLQHRDRAGLDALVVAGLDVWSVGENIGYHTAAEGVALRHFEGWRESDGHFCNLMDPGFTHLGVGQSTRDGGISFAVQNFFSLR